MKCREAESLIQAYITDEMPVKKQAEFIEHVKSCSSCYDELETYFTIHFAIKYLDEDQHANYNFKDMLIADIRRKEKRIINIKIEKVCTIVCIAAFIILVLCVLFFILKQKDTFSMFYIWEKIKTFFEALSV